MFINAELSTLPITDGRKAERRIVNLAAALREEGATTSPVIVADISISGFKVETSAPPAEGQEVWLKIAGLEAKRSRVVWTKAEEAGCEFETPLHPGELQMVVAPKSGSIKKNVFRRV